MEVSTSLKAGMTESSGDSKQTPSSMSELHAYDVLLFHGWCPMPAIPLADSTACAQRELGCEAGSLRDNEPETRECAIYIAVWLICLYAKVYKLLSVELETQLSIAVVAQANQTIQYFRNT